MAVKLRLKKMGAKGRPFYRIVASDSRSPRDGRFLDTVGTYNPIEKDAPVTVDEEKALYWLGNGAQPTDTVRSILSKQGIMKKYADSKKKPAKKKTTTAKKETTAKKTTKKSEK